MKAMWIWFRLWIHDSETVLWARAQVLVGAIIAALALIDPTVLHQFVTNLGLEQWWPGMVIAGGIITELVRRSREPHNLGVSTAADLTKPKPPLTGDKV